MPKSKLSFDPPVLDLKLYAGDGPSFHLVVKDPAGAPVNLTGTMLAQIRDERGDDDPPLAAFECDLSSGSAGAVILKLSGEDTQALAPVEKFEGVWDLEWTATDEEPLTLCQGKVECFPDVSR
jgi:hypothetical protein